MSEFVGGEAGTLVVRTSLGAVGVFEGGFSGEGTDYTQCGAVTGGGERAIGS